MKRYILLTTLFLIGFKFITNGQEGEPELPFSTIYLVRTASSTGASINCRIQFPNQQTFSLPPASVVQYKIYSEGEISIEAIYDGFGVYYCNLNIQRGNDYYVYLNVKKFSEVNKAEVLKLLNNPKNTAKREENLDSPINKKSIHDLLKKNLKGQGTCFIISPEGYFVTNFHCVDDAKEISIRGIGGDFSIKYPATLIATDPSNDLALIKINDKSIKLPPPLFGLRTTGVAQAEKVFALGFPMSDVMGQEMKVNEGIISAKSGVQGDVSRFQISAAVNPGNSGGPLIDGRGNLIGVIYAKSTIAESAGYAIKGSYLDAFLKNVDGFKYTFPSINTSNQTELSNIIAGIKKGVFIIERN